MMKWLKVIKMSTEALPPTIGLCDAKALSIRPVLSKALPRFQFRWIGNGIFQDVHECSAVRGLVSQSATAALPLWAEIFQVDDRWCILISQL